MSAPLAYQPIYPKLPPKPSNSANRSSITIDLPEGRKNLEVAQIDKNSDSSSCKVHSVGFMVLSCFCYLGVGALACGLIYLRKYELISEGCAEAVGVLGSLVLVTGGNVSLGKAYGSSRKIP